MGGEATAQQVRRAVVAAQRIPAAGSVPAAAKAAVPAAAEAADVLRAIGLIQLDPLTRVSTAQRLTSLTRLPPGHRAEDVDASLWPAAGPVGFEAFTKVACLFPIEDWPLLQLRRDRVREQTAGSVDPALIAQIREVVGSHPGGARIGAIERACGSERTTGWNWSQIKKVAELMVRTGDLVITAREGIVRLFDLPERALPSQLRRAERLSADELLVGLARRAAATLGVMTVADLAHHYAMSPADARRAVQAADLEAVEAEGWKETGYCLPGAIEPAQVPPPATSASTPGAWGAPRGARLIGPFDPLLRDRSRARRIFDFDYTFEAYVPAAERRFGHYVMAVLSGERLIGRVDLQRASDRLIVNRSFPEAGVRRRALEPRVRAACGILAGQLGVEVAFC